MRRAIVVTALTTLVTLLVAVPAASGAPDPDRAGEAARIDFNDDGFFDLAVGAPLEDVGTALDAGAVTAFSAAGGGVLTREAPFIQGTGGLGGRAESGDLFGLPWSSLAG